MLITISRPHHSDFSEQLRKAFKVAEYAVFNKNNKKVLTSPYVEKHGLPSAISNQILRKYSQPKIKRVRRVNLVVPGGEAKKMKKYKGYTQYGQMKFNPSTAKLCVTPLSFEITWHPGRVIEKINQVEISATHIFVTITVPTTPSFVPKEHHVLGVDLNCGRGRHIAVVADLSSRRVEALGKSGPAMRNSYFKKRRKAQAEGNHKMLREMGHREKLKMKDLDHKISKRIVDLAVETKSVVVMENLKGLNRNKTKQNKGKKALNRTVSSWSYYRLQTYIAYKCQAAGVLCVKVPPEYTSQYCSYCGYLGLRDRELFICDAKRCPRRMVVRDSDSNAAFCIAKRHLGLV